MKILSKVLLFSACLVAANVKASEPENNRFKGGFFVGLGIPTYFVGNLFNAIGKEILKANNFSLSGIGLGARGIGTFFRGTGASLVLIPMFINRQLIVNNVKNASQYRLKLEKKQNTGE